MYIYIFIYIHYDLEATMPSNSTFEIVVELEYQQKSWRKLSSWALKFAPRQPPGPNDAFLRRFVRIWVSIQTVHICTVHLALMFKREGTNQLSIPWEVERGKSLRDLNRIRLLNSRSDLDLEIGIVRDMSETLVLLT